MSTETISAAAGSGSEVYVPPDKTSLGKDDFLKLFVAQLENQDPLSPMEGTDLSNQLAQFSSLEQLTNANQNLEYLLLYQSSMNNAEAVNFIGKTVKAVGDSISVKDGTSSQIQFDLAGDAAEVNVYIYDSSDNLVKTINCGSLSDGEQSIEWDGTNENGETVSDGTYTMEVSATDGEGETIVASTYMTVEVTGATFKEGNAYLLAGDIAISMSDVLEVTRNSELEGDDS